jgi:uncharacterized membrane protein
MNKIKIIVFVILGLNFSACYYDKEQTLYPNKFVVDTSSVSYAALVKPLIDSKCATSGCHDATAVGSVRLTTYAEVFAKKDRIKVRSIDEKTMPTAGPLSSSEISILQRWLDQGAKNN